MGFFDFFKQADINQGIEEYKATADAVLVDVRTQQTGSPYAAAHGIYQCK